MMPSFFARRGRLSWALWAREYQLLPLRTNALLFFLRQNLVTTNLDRQKKFTRSACELLNWMSLVIRSWKTYIRDLRQDATHTHKSRACKRENAWRAKEVPVGGFWTFIMLIFFITASPPRKNRYICYFFLKGKYSILQSYLSTFPRSQFSYILQAMSYAWVLNTDRPEQVSLRVTHDN